MANRTATSTGQPGATRTAVLRLDRFRADPTLAEELLARRNALVAAVREAVPGLVEARLVRIDDETWIDMWHWDSRASAQAAAARARAGNIPEAAAAFALTREVVTELADVVDER
jgi:antibiotic biosynthesis monooxygenase